MNFFGSVLQYGEGIDMMSGAALGGGIVAFLLGFALVGLVIFAAVYVFMSLALMAVAKKLKTEPAWLAWVPIGNLYLMSKMAKMHWWPILLLIGYVIPYINIITNIALMVFMIIWQWKVCEARKRPGWWAVLQLIPVVGWIWAFIMWGILAWGKD